MHLYSDFLAIDSFNNLYIIPQFCYFQKRYYYTKLQASTN